MNMSHGICLLLIIAILRSATAGVMKRVLTEAPLNEVALVGSTVVLRCRSTDPSPVSRVQWWEVISHLTGKLISDMDAVNPSHPNNNRYRIIHESPIQFDLEIRDVTINDGGKYLCMDVNGGPEATFRGWAELIVLASNPVCTSAPVIDGGEIEEQMYIMECIINYQGNFAPKMNWSGPPPFKETHSSLNPNTVWSRIEFIVDRSMDGKWYECLTNFAEVTGLPEDHASNAPTYEHLYRSDQLFVYWPPRNMSADPILQAYQVGDTITCHADANPPAYYMWQNMRTFEVFNLRVFTITEEMVGQNTQLRCQAQNMIQLFVYSNNLFLTAYVPLNGDTKGN